MYLIKCKCSAFLQKKDTNCVCFVCTIMGISELCTS